MVSPQARCDFERSPALRFDGRTEAMNGKSASCRTLSWSTRGADVRYWHQAALRWRAEHVCSARVIQTSTCSAMASASSTSMPR